MMRALRYCESVGIGRLIGAYGQEGRPKDENL